MRKLRFHPCGNFNERYEEELAIFETDFGRLWLVIGLALLFVVVPLTCKAYTLYVINLMGIAAIAAIGLNILIGFTGQISLGHGAFFGVGAYSAAVLATPLGFPFLLSVLAAGVITAREKFEREYGIDTYQMYGATEVGDIAYECREKSHWHICEEVIVEIVDPATGKQLEPGQLGEVVVTRQNSMFFLFRFGTGDLSSFVEELCPCGRTSLRLTGISGRVGEAAKVRGMFIAPSQLRRVAFRFGGLKLQAVVDRSGFKDQLTVRVEFGVEEADRTNFQRELEACIKEICTVKVDRIEFIEKGALSDKDSLIVDRRQWK